MEYRYYTCDVFTEARFGGNPLAVLPHAEGLSARQMQRIAREFNYSETTFVLPAESGHTRKVRIFTPATELPFAGHPNIGTAFVLAVIDELELDNSNSITFEELAGPVSIDIEVTGGGISCELKAPQALSLGREFTPEEVAPALSLDRQDIDTAAHVPRVASVGLEFLMVELRSRAALERARPDIQAFEALAASMVHPSIHLYARTGDDFDIRARMFAPLGGVPEDPATGSANCALAALLAQLSPRATETASFRIAQGVEMGRPGTLLARTEKKDGEVVGVWIGGTSVLVSEGVIHVDRE